MKNDNVTIVTADEAGARHLAESESARQVVVAALTDTLARKVIPFMKANARVENDQAWRRRLARLETRKDLWAAQECARIRREELGAEPLTLTPEQAAGVMAYATVGASPDELRREKK